MPQPLPPAAPAQPNADLPHGPAARNLAFIGERLATDARNPLATPRGLERAASTAADSTATDSTTADTPLPTVTVLPAAQRLRELDEYRSRLAQFGRAIPGVASFPTARAASAVAANNLPPGLTTNRWTSLGPQAVQARPYGRITAYSGRVSGIALAPGGRRLYIATANGGVWRSADGGTTWQALMDAFDLNPTAHQSDSLACGAIALVAGEWIDQDIIYVGSGEGHGAANAYYGVGPIVSVDGGLNWYTEPSDPPLLGMAFYALAVDPMQPERVVAATTNGLYLREVDGTGGYRWQQKALGEFSSVVVSHGDRGTVFYAARKYDGVYTSTDGSTWTPLGRNFPTDAVGRIGLAVQAYYPDVVYALVAGSAARYRADGTLICEAHHLHGLYRFELAQGEWQAVAGIPPKLFGVDLTRQGQGWYDLALALAPDTINRVYLGGAAVLSDGLRDEAGALQEWAAALYRCEISQEAKGTFRAEASFIGASVHADVHALALTPGAPNKLYVGCDGGVFCSTDPTGDPPDASQAAGLFSPCNAGLATMTMNYLGLHPTEEALIFCGTQDNGGLRFSGDEIWQLSAGGDCGYCVINPLDPYHVLTTYTYGSINRSLDGGGGTFYDAVAVPLAAGEAWSTLFYAPLVGAPYDQANKASADLVAFGSNRVWLSEHFGGNRWWIEGDPWQYKVDWHSIPSGEPSDDTLPGAVRSLSFASARKLYAGTMAGTIHRFDKSGRKWTRTDLPPIPNLMSPITCIAVDPSDSSGNTIYITVGGYTDQGRIWRFDGKTWQPRMGPADQPTTQLMNVQHNSIVVDSRNPEHLFVGADIGIWHSGDRGETWAPFSRGLPDAAVLDIKQHGVSGALYAATHGRGVYEFNLYVLQSPVELYIRDHQLDLGRARAIALSDAQHPLTPQRTLRLGDSPDIKFDLLDAAGNYALTDPALDFFRFANELPDLPAPVTLYTHDEVSLVNRVYVQVHSHGAGLARHVRVILLLGQLQADAIPPLPAGYDARLRNGAPIENEAWLTISYCDLYNVRAEQPQVARFDLRSDLLPTSSELAQGDNFVLLAIVHSYADPFFAGAHTVLDQAERKVAGKFIQIAPFTGTLKARLRKRRKPKILAKYQVKSGDSLWKIAKQFYGDGERWPSIYRFNRTRIGNNPRQLRVGIELNIGALSSG